MSQSPIGESVHLYMTCLDLGMSMSSVEFGNNAYVFKLWMDSRDEVVIQSGVPLSVLIGG